MASILIIDDHRLVASGTKNLLQEAGFQAELLFSAEELQKSVEKTHFDLFLVDWNLPEVNGMQITEKIIQRVPEARVVIYTGFDKEIPPVFDELIDKGVSGIISKSAAIETLIASIRAVLGGQSVFPLSMLRQVRSRSRLVKEAESVFDEREQEIIKGVIDRKTNRVIADQLHISQRTMEYQLEKIYRKLGIHSRDEVQKRVKEIGLVLQTRSFKNKS
ncbi:response regulator transcription factor [Sporolactobacillus putidus]|uniref:DNA-binding response regulator n=1 Tax=Sporolactobacillus putidus TaxID=492735 RepID=A0A917RY45_9BACL|nr:response regulator transcription factor [Sporolactobacillus putidus]GGL44456.1 DNA-binding response regulator [Sporolactobacillus putidus]